MNENIDLTKILKDCPKGWEFHSSIYGKVYFEEMRKDEEYPVVALRSNRMYASFSRVGKYDNEPDSECCLFPSKEQRDWSKFTAPWYKKEKFDPKTLKAFDMVLVRDHDSRKWSADFYSHKHDSMEYPYRCIGEAYTYCIPYNEETKHLVGTTDDAPGYYRYWED